MQPISLETLLASVGKEVGLSPWRVVTQTMIDQFADATDDHQFIHCDPARAAAEAPFGGTIAHGFLTLSLIPFLGVTIFAFETPGAKLNYGVNKVRFPQPVVVGSKVRGTAVLTDAQEINGGVQAVITITVEIEGVDKPACIVESVSRFLR